MNESPMPPEPEDEGRRVMEELSAASAAFVGLLATKGLIGADGVRFALEYFGEQIDLALTHEADAVLAELGTSVDRGLDQGAGTAELVADGLTDLFEAFARSFTRLEAAIRALLHGRYPTTETDADFGPAVAKLIRAAQNAVGERFKERCPEDHWFDEMVGGEENRDG